MTAVQYPLTIFYDASCSMCAGEMEAIKKRDADGRIILVDCSAPAFEDAALVQGGFCRTDAMTLIHARDADGRWLGQGIVIARAAATQPVDEVGDCDHRRRRLDLLLLEADTLAHPGEVEELHMSSVRWRSPARK